MDWNKVPGHYPESHYEVDVPWTYLERWVEGYREDGLINLSPDYQRAHVWTKEQQSSFVEYALRGGDGAKVLYWNSINWDKADFQELELVDGKQRLEAIRAFLRGELEVFNGHRYEPEKTGKRLSIRVTVKMRICALPTRVEVLRWYLSINAGGTPHSKEELERVQALLREEERKSVL